jgi:hypothetical protein
MASLTRLFISLVLVLSQVAAAVTAGFGGIVCHEPDGRVHVESWVEAEAEDCHHHAAPKPEAASVEESSCVDVPLVADGVLSQRAQTPDVKLFIATLSLLPYAAIPSEAFALFPPSRVNASPPFPSGSLAELKTVVLLV